MPASDSGGVDTFGNLRYLLATLDARAAAAALEQLSELPVHAFLNAQGNTYRGNVDLAFEWLERAYRQRNAGLCQIKVQPLLRNLHADPRWQLFLNKMGLGDLSLR